MSPLGAKTDVDTVVGMLAVPVTGALVSRGILAWPKRKSSRFSKRAESDASVLSSVHAPKSGSETLPLKALAEGHHAATKK